LLITGPGQAERSCCQAIRGALDRAVWAPRGPARRGISDEAGGPLSGGGRDRRQRCSTSYPATGFERYRDSPQGDAVPQPPARSFLRKTLFSDPSDWTGAGRWMNGRRDRPHRPRGCSRRRPGRLARPTDRFSVAGRGRGAGTRWGTRETTRSVLTCPPTGSENKWRFSFLWTYTVFDLGHRPARVPIRCGFTNAVRSGTRLT